jgi:hypothetical protein
MDGKSMTAEDLQGLMTLMDDVRCDIIEAQKQIAAAHVITDSMAQVQDFTQAIQKTCDTLLRRLEEPVVPGLQGSLDEILQVTRAEKQAAPLQTKRLAGLAVGLALLSGACGWYVGHTPTVVVQRARLMESVHAVLMERPALVPAELKTKLAAVYGQHGFARELMSQPQKGAKP